MSVVIVGGNERMVCKYVEICKGHGCRAKVYPKENGSMKRKIGRPDLLILFTNTVSHKMAVSASQEAKRNKVPIAHVHTSSASALRHALRSHLENSNKLQQVAAAATMLDGQRLNRTAEKAGANKQTMEWSAGHR